MQMFNQTVRAAVSALAALCLLAGASGLAYAQTAQTSDEWLKSYQEMLQRNDAAAARASLEARVATGDPVALSEQGDAFRTGSIYTKDLNRAFVLLQQAATAGNVWSMSVVGLMLRDGEVRAQDWAGALVWFQRAADTGHAWSANEVGFAHEHGKGGLKINHVEALKWYLKAAEGGEPMAMTNTGLYYQYGSPGVSVDVEKARFWYEKAVQAGYEPARPRLASLPSKQTAQQQAFVPRPLPGPQPEQIALFNTALRAAAQMGFKADSIDNDTCKAELRHNYQGNEVKFSLSVPVVGRLRGSIRVFDDNIREGFIRLYRQELVKALNGAQIELDGNITGR
jgi:TPR repeat protein